MKKLILFLMILLIISNFSVFAFASEGYSDSFRDAVSLENSLLSNETNLNDPSSVSEDIKLHKIWDFLGRCFSLAWGDGLKNLICGLGMVLLSVVLNRCSGNIQNQNLQFLFSFIVSISAALMCEGRLRESAKLLEKSIEDMGIFTAACIPSFSVVMIAAGEGATSAVFSGAMVFLGEMGALISKNVLLPLTQVYLSIGICSAVSDEFNFMTIGRNIKRFVIWAIGIFMVLFRLILKLQNGIASAGDLLSKKYIRAAVGGLIPVVGNTLSQGVDGLFAAAQGVKTSFAVAGVLIVLSILLPILISVGIQGLGWSICRWFAEFMNDATMRSISDVLANSFYVMLALGAAVAIMGIISFFGVITQVA